MLKKTMHYTDYNGNEQKKDLYFHLSRMEVVRIQADLDLLKNEEMDSYAIRLAESGDLSKMLQFIDLIVQRSYGVRSADGVNFDKSPETLQALLASPIYDTLIEDLLLVDGSVQEFAKGIGVLGKSKPKLTALAEPSVQATLTPDQLLAKLQANPELLEQLSKE